MQGILTSEVIHDLFLTSFEHLKIVVLKKHSKAVLRPNYTSWPIPMGQCDNLGEYCDPHTAYLLCVSCYWTELVSSKYTRGHAPGVTSPNYHSKELKLLYHYPLYIFQCCSPIHQNVLHLEEQGAILNDDLIIKKRKRNTLHQSLLQVKVL